MIRRSSNIILTTLVLLLWSSAGLAQTRYYAGKTDNAGSGETTEKLVDEVLSMPAEVGKSFVPPPQGKK
jgi:hypothetical protein